MGHLWFLLPTLSPISLALIQPPPEQAFCRQIIPIQSNVVRTFSCITFLFLPWSGIWNRHISLAHILVQNHCLIFYPISVNALRFSHFWLECFEGLSFLRCTLLWRLLSSWKSLSSPSILPITSGYREICLYFFLFCQSTAPERWPTGTPTAHAT